jgi:hypothetical protein
MEGSDLSAAVALRMKLGHAASSLKPLGLLTGFMAFVTLYDVIGQWSATAVESEGLVWEFERVASLGLMQKLVLLFPPLPAEELKIRWAKIVGRARALGLTSEPEFREVRALVWTRAGGHFLTAGKHDDWTYETVLDAAAASMQLCTRS